MKGFLAIDEWLLRQYQKAADWCYSEWDVSPYAVSAQLFAVAGIISVIHYCLGIGVFLFGAMLMANTAWFWNALTRDSAWKKKRMPMPLTPFDTGLRIFFLGITCGAIGSTVLVPEPSLKEVLYLLQDIVSVCAYYFYACNPPTFIERRDQRLVPQT